MKKSKDEVLAMSREEYAAWLDVQVKRMGFRAKFLTLLLLFQLGACGASIYAQYRARALNRQTHEWTLKMAKEVDAVTLKTEQMKAICHVLYGEKKN